VQVLADAQRVRDRGQARVHGADARVRTLGEGFRRLDPTRVRVLLLDAGSTGSGSAASSAGWPGRSSTSRS
jgi:hypothetical protein